MNLSRIVRAASCCGVPRIVVCGNFKIDRKIARDGAEQVTVESHRTLPPVLKKLRDEGYRLVGLNRRPTRIRFTNIASSAARH